MVVIGIIRRRAFLSRYEAGETVEPTSFIPEVEEYSDDPDFYESVGNCR